MPTFEQSSSFAGQKYGYPKCCVRQFIMQTPEYLKKHGVNKTDKLRFKMAHVNGVYSGFIPCSLHAMDIAAGKIKLADLITGRDPALLPFPFDWPYK